MYIYPEFFELSCLVTFITSKIALLIFYLTQEIIQNLYNAIDKLGENRLIFRIVLFLFRVLYASLLTFAAVLQYRTYWDFFNGIYQTNMKFSRFIHLFSFILRVDNKYRLQILFCIINCNNISLPLLS